MYIGINSEKGKRVYDDDAFGYACQRMSTNPESEEAITFKNMLLECKSVSEFIKEYTEWWFSGDWLHKEDSNAQLD